MVVLAAVKLLREGTELAVTWLGVGLGSGLVARVKVRVRVRVRVKVGAKFRVAGSYRRRPRLRAAAPGQSAALPAV